MLPGLFSLEFRSSVYNPGHPHPGQNGSRTDALSQWKLFKNISKGLLVLRTSENNNNNSNPNPRQGDEVDKMMEAGARKKIGHKFPVKVSEKVK